MNTSSCSRSPSRSPSPSLANSTNNRSNPFSIDYILSSVASTTATAPAADHNSQLKLARRHQLDGTMQNMEMDPSQLRQSSLPLVEQLNMIQTMTQKKAQLMAQLQAFAVTNGQLHQQTAGAPSEHFGNQADQQQIETFRRLVAEASQEFPGAKPEHDHSKNTRPTAQQQAQMASNPNFLYFMACMLLQQQQQKQACQQSQTAVSAVAQVPPASQQSPMDSLSLLARLTNSSAGVAPLQLDGGDLQATYKQQNLNNNGHQHHQAPTKSLNQNHAIRRLPYPQMPTSRQAGANSTAFSLDLARRQAAEATALQQLQQLQHQQQHHHHHSHPQLGPYSSLMSSMQQALDVMAQQQRQQQKSRLNPLAPASQDQHQHMLAFQQHQQQFRGQPFSQAANMKSQQASSATAHRSKAAGVLEQAQQQQHLAPTQQANSLNSVAMSSSCGSSQSNGTKRGAGSPAAKQQQQDNLKPAHSYIGLIAMCILSTPDRRMVLNDIYQFILDHYPYYRNRGSGWRNSVRHNLSLNECFQKDIRAPNGKGHYWRIHPANMADFMNGDFRRRRAQRQVRRHNNMEVPSDESDDESMEDATRPPLPEHFKRSLEMHRQLEMIYGKPAAPVELGQREMAPACRTPSESPIARDSHLQHQHLDTAGQEFVASVAARAAALAAVASHQGDPGAGKPVVCSAAPLFQQQQHI